MTFYKFRQQAREEDQHYISAWTGGLVSNPYGVKLHDMWWYNEEDPVESVPTDGYEKVIVTISNVDDYYFMAKLFGVFSGGVVYVSEDEVTRKLS